MPCLLARRSMSGIWSEGEDGRLRPAAPHHFESEKQLHDVIQDAPGILPLAGSPSLAVVGREFPLGPGRADLLAFEVDTGRPVIIEIKMAANSDRRTVLTQVLGYAAALRHLDFNAVEQVALSLNPGVAGQGIADLIAQSVQDADFTPEAFREKAEHALKDGRVRCVVVMDSAPASLLELTSYLQEVTDDRLALDLVAITAYSLGDRRVIVPQLVEADPWAQKQIFTSMASKPVKPSPGCAPFEAAFASAPEPVRAELARLTAWVRQLEADGLATPYSSEGKGRWVLNPRIPGQERGFVTVWFEGTAKLSPYRTVLAAQAPRALEVLDAACPGQIGQGNFLAAPYSDRLLAMLRAAYEEVQR